MAIMKSAYTGCLLGLAVGDALGATVDGKSYRDICRDYGPAGLLGYDLVNGFAQITSHTQVAAFACNGLLIGTARGQKDLLGCISRVDGTSMDHTLHHGQRLIGLRTEYNPWQRVERGDIVVVKSKALGKMLVKRVIGVPGDEVRIADNQVYVNGVLLEEDYIAEPMRTEDGLWILNEEQYFLLGDNRNVSNDSRYLGPVTQKEMYAVMIFDLSGFSKIERPAVYETLA